MMTRLWTRRQVLAQAGIAAAAVYTLDPHELCCGVNAYAQTASEEKFALKKVGDGIWAAVAEVRYKVNSNAAVIETNDGVIIVDTHSKPSAARSLYKEIQAVSKKPVRKIINTHFHWDHWQGNEVYASANPGLEIISTEQTKQNLTTPDVGVGGVPFIEKQLAALPGEIAMPTRTVSKTVTLQEGGREIQLHVLGRGHTNGDLYIYMPKEKVVATGDAVVDWMPFLNDGYPEEWAQTVAALEKLDIVQIIPGHGEPAPKAHLAFFRGYLTDLVAAVKTAAAGGATLDEMKTKVADQLAPKYEKGMSRYPVGQFRDRIDLNVEMVHKKVVAKS
jgi:cyclase